MACDPGFSTWLLLFLHGDVNYESYSNKPGLSCFIPGAFVYILNSFLFPVGRRKKVNHASERQAQPGWTMGVCLLSVTLSSSWSHLQNLLFARICWTVGIHVRGSNRPTDDWNSSSGTGLKASRGSSFPFLTYLTSTEDTNSLTPETLNGKLLYLETEGFFFDTQTPAISQPLLSLPAH
jgi:hypothetical protein